MASQPLYAIVDYKDAYVQPLLLSALQSQLPADLLKLIPHVSEAPSPVSARLLQWRQYEEIDFERLAGNPSGVLANSYIIRKALIRKHYLSATVSHWSSKHTGTLLTKHVPASVEFEVDYAEFLDDALVEAFELRDSWARNAALPASAAAREWWILKPGMSERGQGIRLFSSEEELQAIFQEWDPPSDDDEDEDEDEEGKEDELVSSTDANARSSAISHEPFSSITTGVVTSHLRHFVAQPYIPRPLLLPPPHHAAGRKFHIRTYVLAVGALKVYVYRPMLALFAALPYTAPTCAESPNDSLASHLTNTCLQTGEREGSVHAFWSLPQDIPDVSGKDWREDVFRQISAVTGELFEAAARSMTVHFQPLPNAFEVFGLDFLVDSDGIAWLLEVNAFPDFAQTGGELQDIIRNLFVDVVDVAVKPFVGLPSQMHSGNRDSMVQVLDIDLGRG